ncbi:short chain dehydrogenase [Lentithecium fluviatile CBS 122367]|uniref:Short chain dehydrogenase n=1 Tax=Lentithecium fluviatile CBS 122367 TaxID=1168545 RepID=A0A6G1IV04_9PLEO|nr:short chain dehydrogenase [Lentithecium fluviatile CBS 122367]
MPDQTKYTNKLQNARILIIGGSAGIGYGVAEACIEHGAHVVISSSNPTRVQTAVNKIKNAYPSKASNIIGLTVDLGKQDTLDSELARLFKRTVEEIGGKEGKLDHVVYTAGDALAVGKMEDMSIEGILKAGQIRFFAPLLAAKYIKPHLVPSPNSSYTITTGAISERPQPDWAVVAAYAGGLHSMVRNLSLDLKPVRVNGVSPGAVDTELWQMMGEEKTAIFGALERRLATGRVGRVEDVVESYLGVLRDGFMDGSVVRSDGGALVV